LKVYNDTFRICFYIVFIILKIKVYIFMVIFSIENKLTRKYYLNYSMHCVKVCMLFWVWIKCTSQINNFVFYKSKKFAYVLNAKILSRSEFKYSDTENFYFSVLIRVLGIKLYFFIPKMFRTSCFCYTIYYAFYFWYFIHNTTSYPSK
jgi:hypothetical protein